MGSRAVEDNFFTWREGTAAGSAAIVVAVVVVLVAELVVVFPSAVVEVSFVVVVVVEEEEVASSGTLVSVLRRFAAGGEVGTMGSLRTVAVMMLVVDESRG